MIAQRAQVDQHFHRLRREQLGLDSVELAAGPPARRMAERIFVTSNGVDFPSRLMIWRGMEIRGERTDASNAWLAIITSCASRLSKPEYLVVCLQ